MQGAHDWAENLDKTFQGHGYYKSYADPQICSRVLNNELTLISIWTDDILGASSTAEGEKLAKYKLGSSYEIKDIGEAKLILGIHITQNKNGDITLTQKAYSKRMLECFKMNHCVPTSTPLPPGSLLLIDDCPTISQETSEMAKTPYHEALGLLMWLQVATHPDLTYAVNILFRFSHNPGRSHWNALKHILIYVKGTIDYGITYRGGGTLNPIGYMDSDYAGCKDTKHSTEGNVFIVAGEPVSWESKCQETVALSIVESEYMAFVKNVQSCSRVAWSRVELLWSGKEFTTKMGEQPWPQLVCCALICCRVCGCVFQED